MKSMESMTMKSKSRFLFGTWRQSRSDSEITPEPAIVFNLRDASGPKGKVLWLVILCWYRVWVFWISVGGWWFIYQEYAMWDVDDRAINISSGIWN